MKRKQKQSIGGTSSVISTHLTNAKESGDTHLKLSGLGLTELPNDVFELTNLEIIDISGNSLKTISERLWDLPHLREIYVAGNPLSSLPTRPGMTIDASLFSRFSNQLRALKFGLVIGRLTSNKEAAVVNAELALCEYISHLIIGTRTITVGELYSSPTSAMQMVLKSLGRFHSLRSISLRGLGIENIPEEISTLRHLRYLGFDGLQLRRLPDWIGELDLEGFSAVYNELTTLPESFRALTNLKHLHISWNPLNTIPHSVFELSSLAQLSIRECNITTIPQDILKLAELDRLNCEGNPIEAPPREIANNGLEAIRDYWRQRADVGVDYLCEAKLIILGEPGAGKTTLAHKIENRNYKLSQSEASTEGIDVIRYEFPTTLRTYEGGAERPIQRSFQVNIWDFGGQEIYHATHQFFLTRRSVYVLVCDDRKEDTDFSYWLQVVEMLSDASPLLIVQNEKQDRCRDINLGSLRARFANLQEAIPTNLETNRGLDRVVQTIQKQLELLPHVGVGLPATWKRVREALESDNRNFISLAEYLSLCQELGFRQQKDKLQLSGYLHDLGVCLHFQDDSTLKNIVVLKPSWGTDAVYRVLDDPGVIAARGHFTRSQLDSIWYEEKYDGMHDELLQLMMKFQLCYALEAGESYIAPQLLDSQQPSYSWDFNDELVVRYVYEFLPKGIVTRFIVALHRLISGGNLVWKTGVVLERDGSRAEVIEEYSQRRIRVRVSGANPLGLLSIVDDRLSQLHSAFPRLRVERYLPCPCEECEEKAEPYGFALENLIKMARKGTSIQCHASGEMVDAALLVENVLPGALRQSYGIERVQEAVEKLPPSSPTPEVFVSYAWSEESNAIVDRLQKVLEEKGIRLLRDREEVRYKNSIREFMTRMGRGKCVIVVISEKYLKSENCMFEMVQIAKAQQLRERVFPIVLHDANIYKATGRVKYVNYWESEIQELDEALKTVRGDNLQALQEDLNVYAEIRRLFDGIAGTLRDMNALAPDQHTDSEFGEMIKRIRAQIDGEAVF